MKFKNKGRKIYKTKEKNYYGKSPVGKFMSGALTVLLIGGIGFLGYSVAEPIINYTKHKGDEPTVTEPPVIPVTTGAADVTASVTTEPVTEAHTEAPETYYTAAALSESALQNADTLRAALSALSAEEIQFVELPLKVTGGAINYASIVPEAVTAVKSSMTLTEMIQEVESKGFEAAASLSVFKDNSLPIDYPDAGYVKADDGSQWVDANGLPWVSPYSQRAIDYNTNIVIELTYYGFSNIICKDLVFPDFSKDDLENLDPVLGQNDRCMSLTSAANLLYDKAVSNGASMQIEISAEDIFCGRTDILQPMLLSSNNIILNINLDTLTNGVIHGENEYKFSGTQAEKVEQCLEVVSEYLVDFNAGIKLSGQTLNKNEIPEIKKVLTEYGYKSLIVG